MAIAESDCLHIHKGGASYLLLRSTTHFHLIRMDTDLSEARMARLLRIYPCSPEQLQKMGFHFSAFKAANLRGVVFYGYKAGDTLELWLGGEARKYQLAADYPDEILSSFFSGCPIVKRLPHQWEGLDPAFIKIATWSLNTIAIACSIAFYCISVPYKLWSALCILCQLSALVLALVYPASFTLDDDSKKAKTYVNKGKGHLLPACFAPCFSLCLRTLTDFTFTDNAICGLLIITLIISAVLLAGYIRINKGLRNGLLNALAVIFALVFLNLGTIGQLNYLLDFNQADRQVVQVVDKEITRRSRSTDFDCTVVFPNGETMELTLPARIYREIDTGDDVIVAQHGGAFHIPFSTVELLPDETETG